MGNNDRRDPVSGLTQAEAEQLAEAEEREYEAERTARKSRVNVISNSTIGVIGVVNNYGRGE